MIGPTLTYSAEGRNESIKAKQETKMSAIKVLSRIARKMRRDRERNKNVRETCKMDIIEE